MQMLAWQTALLMTATGNYKKAIKAEDLYKSLNQAEHEKQSKKTEAEKEAEKLKLQKELLDAFSL